MLSTLLDLPFCPSGDPNQTLLLGCSTSPPPRRDPAARNLRSAMPGGSSPERSKSFVLPASQHDDDDVGRSCVSVTERSRIQESR